MGRLVEQYWRPVYWVIRNHWGKAHADAKDLTQEFFAHTVFEGGLVQKFAPERGSFRAFLRGALTNFLSDAKRTAERVKRGGQTRIISLDDEIGDDSALLGDLRSLSPEDAFNHAWNHWVAARAIERLRQRLEADGKAAFFEVYRRYELESDREAPSYDQVGADLGLKAHQVKYALTHARQQMRDVITGIVRDYVDGPDDLAAELRLFRPPAK